VRGDEGFPVRLRFDKRGKVRFVGHRDLARAFERAFRIVELPLTFTAGFSPRPKVSFGLALSVGYESDAEYLDVALTHDLDVDALPSQLSAELPVGVDVTGAVGLADRAPALQESVSSVAYRITVDGVSDLDARVEAVTASPSLIVTRTRKGLDVTEDLRAVLWHLDIVETHSDGGVIEFETATRPGALRASDILTTLGVASAHVVRTNQWIERAGSRLEPLEADTRVRVPEACAS
jgi:radical SAM-linked protein